MAYRAGRCLLQDLLDSRDMQQNQLAELLKVKPPQINKYIKNKQKMSLEVAVNIAFILKCSVNDLYEWIWEEEHQE